MGAFEELRELLGGDWLSVNAEGGEAGIAWEGEQIVQNLDLFALVYDS